MNKPLLKIGLFQLSICHLVSIGKSESIEAVENHLQTGDLVEYLLEKYRRDFIDTQIELDEYAKPINKYFSNYDGYIQGNESRKYGIMNSNDGLLLILALISDKISDESVNWTIDL